MMGEKSGAQDQFFYIFNIEEGVAEHHLLSWIDEALDPSDLR